MSSGREESTSELAEIERAGTALREKVLEEFRAGRNSSALNFYKLMAFFPERHRVMWLCKASPPYRAEAKFDENDLYATRVLRRELDEYLKLFCQELPALMQWFIEDLYRMQHEGDWIEREAEEIWPLFKNEYEIWAQIACDGQAADQDWRAPGWLDKWPEELPRDAVLSAARGGRLDAIHTGEVLKLVVERIKTAMKQAQRSALSSLRIRFAQEKEAARCAAAAAPDNPVASVFTAARPEHAPKSIRRKKKQQLTERERKILQILKQDQELRPHGIVYCHALELKKIPPRQEWIDNGCPVTYPEAYKLKKWRHRIQDEKYRLTRFLPEKRTRQSPPTS